MERRKRVSNTPHHIHFLGIAGIGVSALAQVALARGIRVSGSDPHADPQVNPAIRRLKADGATISTEHRADNLVSDVDLVVVSAAVPETNPELQAAHRRRIRVASRADFLGELMTAHRGVKIAVAGTHGKTTTTGMIGVMLQHAGLDPTVFVGGEVRDLGGNVRVGSAEGPFVAEACEAYDSFLSLTPDIAVITNVEADHLDHFGSFDRVKLSFQRFLNNVPRGTGRIVVCREDPGAALVVDGIHTLTPVITYGLESSARSTAENIVLERTAAFEWRSGNICTSIRLRMPGRHNVLNALAAATVGTLLDLPDSVIAAGLNAFHGVSRRQEILGEVGLEGGTVLVMDDYAHHPTEIAATLEALRSAYPDRRLVAIFQPHLYSRTRDFLPEFATVLSRADALVVTDIYAAREAPIEGVRAADIVNQAVLHNPHAHAIFLPDMRDIPRMLSALVRPNDLAVFLGAGNIREQAEVFVAQYTNRERE
jgi:UDP-N-acetylmuramate--alanine ligase